MTHSDDIIYPNAALFIGLHISGAAVLWTGITQEAVWLGVGLYVLRMFGVCAGYHRYFSHRSYKTSRAFQFALAVLAQSSGQKSVLWWAAMHRRHHQYSDTDRDPHSPSRHGVWYAHVGWIFAQQNDTAPLGAVSDLTPYPELLWLHRFERVPLALLAGVSWLVADWAGLVVGFVWSTICLYHATFCINSLAHSVGSRRYVTGDESRNNWLLALITLGEGWHNNHHACAGSARQGFHAWEIDPTYWLLIGLRRVGLIWNLREPPPALLGRKRVRSAEAAEPAAGHRSRDGQPYSGDLTRDMPVSRDPAAA